MEDDDGDGSRSHPQTKRKGKDLESDEGLESGMDTESSEDSENSIGKNWGHNLFYIQGYYHSGGLSAI
jgi:hypothetical protein